MREEQIGDCRLILGDCLEILPTLGKVDAVVTDPPYGINNGYIPKRKPPFQSRSNQAVASNDYFVTGDEAPFDPVPFLVFERIVMWGANHFAHLLPPARQWLIWDKRCGDTSDDQADCEIAWSNAAEPARVFSHKWRGMIKESERSEARVHPTQKPVALMAWCIERAKGGETILDPFMGSGTTGVACVNLSRKFIGIEIEPKYFDIACRRIEEAYRQPRLFAEPQVKPKQEVLL
jgi:site-specific DNA-methyltransferase (adenine-specific)/modification methylase